MSAANEYSPRQAAGYSTLLASLRQNTKLHFVFCSSLAKIKTKSVLLCGGRFFIGRATESRTRRFTLRGCLDSGLFKFKVATRRKCRLAFSAPAGACLPRIKFSGRGESDSVLTHPKGVRCRYATARNPKICCGVAATL